MGEERRKGRYEHTPILLSGNLLSLFFGYSGENGNWHHSRGFTFHLRPFDYWQMDESGMMVNAIDDVFCRSFSSVLLSSSFYSSTYFSSAVLLHLHRLHLFLEFSIFLLHGKENIPKFCSSFLCPSICLSACLSINLSVCLSLHPARYGLTISSKVDQQSFLFVNITDYIDSYTYNNTYYLTYIYNICVSLIT